MEHLQIVKTTEVGGEGHSSLRDGMRKAPSHRNQVLSGRGYYLHVDVAGSPGSLREICAVESGPGIGS